MRRRTVFSTVERAARALAAELVAEVAQELNGMCADLKTAGHRRTRSGARQDGQKHLDLAEAFAAAEVKLRQKACDVAGKWPAPRRPVAEPSGLFEIGGAS